MQRGQIDKHSKRCVLNCVIAVLPDNVRRLTQLPGRCSGELPPVKRHIGTMVCRLSKQHRHGTDGPTDRNGQTGGV